MMILSKSPKRDLWRWVGKEEGPYISPDEKTGDILQRRRNEGITFGLLARCTQELRTRGGETRHKVGELGLRSESRNRSDTSSTDAALMNIFDTTIDSRHIDRSSYVDYRLSTIS
jgi:hypothetical protein